MVNRSIESFLRLRHGDERWREVREAAQVGAVFAITESYPDEVTYALVGAACQVLGTPAEELLRNLGRHWIEFAAENGFRELLGRAGSDLGAFLRGLDAMHARIGLYFPGAKPPSFRCVEAGEGRLALRYYSSREGLQPFVVGLIEGLGDRFGTPATVELVSARGEGRDCDVFDVRWAAE